MLICCANVSFAQRIITIDEVIQRALQRSDQLKAADALIDHDRLIEKTGGFIPDPELILESPTGKFMTLGIQQSFAFPTVYAKQKQLSKAKSALSEQARMITVSELRKRIKHAYLDWQSSQAVLDLLVIQDSLLLRIAQAAIQQYETGQIDFVEKSYAGIKYTDIHSQFLQAQMDVKGRMEIIQRYVGTTESLMPDDLVKLSNDFVFSSGEIDSAVLKSTPIMAYHHQREHINEQAIALEKNQVFPDITVGYLNQADQNTPFPLRLRVGLSIPLWFWQYSTSINAAKTMLAASKSQTAAVAFDLNQAWTTTKNEALKYQIAMTYFEAEGLAQAAEMTEAANRMFSSGQYDYIKYLTTLSDAFLVKQKYLELIRNYNQTLISLQYIIGQ